MPRKATGRDRGRPKGGGLLGEEGQGHRRLTIRLPTALYDQLQAYAEGHSAPRGTPQLAIAVRGLLEHALVCPFNGQAKNIPHPHEDNIRQTENGEKDTDEGTLEIAKYHKLMVATLEGLQGFSFDHTPLRSNNPVSLPILPNSDGENNSLPENTPEQLPASIEGHSRQTEIDIPSYDSSKHMLGRLCLRKHEHGTTGQSLLRIKDQRCLRCEEVERTAKAYAASRKTTGRRKR